MAIHNWTGVNPSVFHDFRSTWIVFLKNALNGGLLPSGYYALEEQVAGETIPDVLALESRDPKAPLGATSRTGATALAEAPPKVRLTVSTEMDRYALKTRSLVIRHSSDNRIVALLEILSPGN